MGRKKGTVPVCAKHPPGRSGKRGLSPFSGLSKIMPTGAAPRRRIERLLLGSVDACVAAVVLVVPLLMGGRHAAGQLVLVALAVSAASAWVVRLCIQQDASWCRSPGDVLLAAGVVLLVVQLLPLGAPLVARLTPHAAEILPLWNGASGAVDNLGDWRCVSLTPGATRAALPLLLAYGLLFLVAVQRIQQVEDVQRLLRWTALSAVLMAGFGLVQWATSNGKFFWFYEHPFATTSDAVHGSFSNRNHFAQFLALGFGPLVWWFQQGAARGRRRPFSAGRARRPGNFDLALLRVPALGMVVLAALLSLSRGGAVAIFVAGAISVTACYRARTLGTKSLVSMAAAGLLIAASLVIHGYDQVSHRLGQLTVGSVEQLDQNLGRRTIWAAVLRAASDCPLLGSGVGSHRDVYPMYLDAPLDVEFTHAESGPLQVLLETGVTGLALLLVGIGLCAGWCVNSFRLCANPLSLRRNSRRLRTGAETSVAFRSAKERHFHGAKGDDATVIDSPVLTAAGIKGPPTAARTNRRLLAAGCSDSPHPRSLPSDRLPLGETAASRCDTHSPSDRSQRIALCVGAVAAGLAANLIHALVDFVWYVPACTALVMLLAGCAFRLWQLAAGTRGAPARRAAIGRHVALAAAVALVLVGAWMVGDGVGPALAQPHWDRYQIMESAEAAGGQLPPDGTGPAQPQDDALPAATAQMIAELEQVVQWEPDHARAHLRLAKLYLRRLDIRQRASESGMPLEQIGAAALAARFPSDEAYRAWLARVLGDRLDDADRAWRHTQRALALCPLQGEGYLYLARMCILVGPNAAGGKPAYLAQALAVRPHDGDVLLEVGREASLAGNLDQAIEYWRQASRSGPSHQRQVIDLLMGRVPIDFFLEKLQPDLAGLRLLDAQYGALGQPRQADHLCWLYRQCAPNRWADRQAEVLAAQAWLQDQLRELRRCRLRLAETEAEHLAGTPAAAAWLEVASLYHQLGGADDELRSAENALRLDPSSLAARDCLARCLAAAGRLAEAEQHLQWCLRRQPEHGDWQDRLREIVKQRIDREGQTVGAGSKSGALR
jgi:O-antigen ligase/tetratricopeptide (TPR) repeat protein